MKLKSIIANWKTTLAGVFTLLAAVGPQVNTLLDQDPLTNPDWQLVTAAVGAFIGLLAARDGDVTSEKSGAQ